MPQSNCQSNHLRCQCIMQCYGHWESDTVLGMRKTGCFGTHVERKSGYLIAFRIDDRQDNAFNTATIKAFSSVPDKLKKSFGSILKK